MYTEEIIRPQVRKAFHKNRMKMGSASYRKGPVSEAVTVQATDALKDHYLERAVAKSKRNIADREYRKQIAAIPKTVCPTIVNITV